MSLNILVETIPLAPLSSMMNISSPVSIPKVKSKLCGMDGCKKKLSLTDFPCKCGNIHCSNHRAPEVHSCTYDFKADHHKVLRKTLDTPIIAKKIDFI